MYRKAIFLGAFGWLTLAGVLHIAADVVSQYLRGKRAPGVETTLYYGLHTGFSLGQILFGLMGILISWSATDLLRSRIGVALVLASVVAWLAFAVFFIEYLPPRIMVAIYGVLVLLAVTVR